MFKKRNLIFQVILLLIFVSISNCFASNTNQLDPIEILTKVDQYRGYSVPFKMNIVVTNYKNDVQDNIIGLTAFVKDRASSFLKYTEPPIDKGKILLMADENIWFYHKKISKPLRLSPRQRLLGGASNADVARANFSIDYLPFIIGNETVNGKDCLILNLKAKNDKVSYGKIMLYVDSISYKPVSGEFFAFSGKLLKTSYYEKYQWVENEEKLAEIKIIDAIFKENTTTIAYSNYQKESLPNYYFNPDYLPRLR